MICRVGAQLVAFNQGHQMLSMLKTYWNIILLKGHAYDLPYRLWLPFFWILLDVGIVLILSSAMGNPIGRDLLIEMADLGYTGLALYFAMWYHNVRPRFVQSYSAMLGVGAMFLFLLAIMVLLVPVGAFVSICSELFYFWILVVFTQILSDALNITFFKAILWMLGIEIARFLVITQLLQGLT